MIELEGMTVQNFFDGFTDIMSDVAERVVGAEIVIAPADKIKNLKD